MGFEILRCAFTALRVIFLGKVGARIELEADNGLVTSPQST